MIEGLDALDRSLFIFLNSLHLNFLDPTMLFLSGQAIWIPLAGVMLWHSFKYSGKRETFYFALFLILTLVASDVTSSYLTKNIINRLRPCREEELRTFIYFFGQKCGGKFGFVSSHASNSFALIWYFLHASDLKSFWWRFLWIIPILVSYSRIYLGVHYPGDVLGGALLGIGCAHFFSWVFRSRGKSEDVPLSTF